jgi:branched-chain amino acid transport system permease protein
MLVASALISGLGLGSMYGLLALGFHVTYAVVQYRNFAQGSMMMLGAVLCFTVWVTFGWPLSAAVPIALLGCAVWASSSSAWQCGRSWNAAPTPG